MPNKLNAAGRHHIPQMRHRVTNWAEYEAGLRRRGSLTMWVTDDAIAAWAAAGSVAIRKLSSTDTLPVVLKQVITTASSVSTSSRFLNATEPTSLRAVNTSLHVVVDNRYVKVKTVTSIKEPLNQQARTARNILIIDDSEKKAGQLAEIAKAQADVRELYAALDAGIHADELKQARGEVKRLRTQYPNDYKVFASLISDGN